MKKIILSLLLLVSFVGAQTASAFSFDWGVTGGFNLTKLKVDKQSKFFDTKGNAGWFAGVKANVGLFAGFGLDGALLYNQMKYSTTATYQFDVVTISTPDVVTINETSRSFAIPINLKYSIGLGKTANVYVTTGPQFDFAIGDKKDKDNATSIISSFEQENMTTSWNVGAGVKLFKHLDLGLSYNFGLSKAAKQSLDLVSGATVGIKPPYDFSDVKANTFKIQATYYF